MIENLRKYTGLMIVVFVILFISFFFLDSSSVRNMSSGRAMLKISGRTYDDKEVLTLGKNSFQLAYGLAGSGDFDFLQFASLLSNADQSDQAPEKFFIGRMILRQAKEEFGVYPGDEEISAYLRTLRIFAGPDQKFNAETYRNFVDKGMGHLGMTEKDLRDLASDVLAYKKIKDIVGTGLIVDRDAVTKNLALENQQVSGELAKLELAPFEEKLQPTEDEIRKFWENIQDSFTTEPKRKFTYIVVAPEPIAEAKVDDAPESLADAAASDEAKKAAAKKKEEDRAKAAAANAEARRTNQLTLDGKVDDFLFKLEEQKGEGFEALAKEYGWETKTTELFTRTAAPKELDLELRSSSRGGKTVDQLFLMDVTSDPFSKISPAVAVGENQWVVARLDSEEKSRAKTFEEARADARAQYISEKAAEALKTAANENITKIKTLLTGGKSFADAAKEVGLTETKAFTAVTSTYRPDGASEPQNLFEASRYAEPGTIADVITESDRAFILYVAKREVVKEADAAGRIDGEVLAATNRNETQAFNAWINTRIDDAKVEQLYKN
ncbi:SurA N-terminal domain-containing protein [Luteolibacter yonseiensis]|uniref:SurA N-terminal domain-containing protein n=1 Tax=Luteolibacter yonseiensis TaxID=1144680 RepID=A0A934V9U9_9BACT|nr:SurA N-terminal domain-containing protein [Luteolibacter yonseiensis]MBK1814176.1 SurA N-terminal domain-containing protein [Luteolibacter yonseiensis]